MKKLNGYALAFEKLYQKTPKAVFAAVAFSYTSTGGEDPAAGRRNFLTEWRILWENGIVSQKPPKEAFEMNPGANPDWPTPQGGA